MYWASSTADKQTIDCGFWHWANRCTITSQPDYHNTGLHMYAEHALAAKHGEIDYRASR